MKTDFYTKLEGWPAVVLIVAALGGVAYGAHSNFAHLAEEQVKLSANLEEAHERNYELIKALAEKEGVISSFQGQISDISSTVGTLEKLSQTDPELLKKYSKVYFLNENYIPKQLEEIDGLYVNKGATNTKILVDVRPYLERLLRDAHNDDIKLLVASAYRSFATQSSLKNAYTVTYGSGANSFSADQGYSEHQLGTTLDFTTEKLGANFNSFASDPAYQWLKNHAYLYGFVLSYPEKNTYYKFEPWHWRFVGIDLARKLHEDGKNFYDLDQREIDKYLIKLFD